MDALRVTLLYLALGILLWCSHTRYCPSPRGSRTLILKPMAYYKLIRYLHYIVAIFSTIAILLFAVYTGLALIELRIPSQINIISLIQLIVVEAVMPNSWLLAMGLTLYAIARILGFERERAKSFLEEALYGELSLHGRYRLDELVSKYGFRDAAELVRFLEEVKTKMSVNIQIDPQGEEVYIQ